MERERESRHGHGRDPTPLPGATLDADLVERAEHALDDLYGMQGLEGRSFLDVGAGGGMASLAAHRLGARRIVSLDPDADALAVTRCLRDDHAGAVETSWSIARATVLDGPWMRDLGTFDVVHAWDVVHHTGDLWAALGHVADAVGPGGRLGVSVGNHATGTVLYPSAARWQRIKQSWAVAPGARRAFIAAAVATWSWAVDQAAPPARGSIPRRHRADAVRWLGQVPYAWSTPQDVVAFMAARGLSPTDVRPGGADGRRPHGFVFRRG